MTAVTSPETGANNSDTALTDSTVPNASPCLSWRPTARQFDEDDVAQLLLGEIGDADRRLAALDLEPLVIFRVLQIARIHQSLSVRFWADSARFGDPLSPVRPCRGACRTARARLPRARRARGSQSRASCPPLVISTGTMAMPIAFFEKRRLRAARDDADLLPVLHHRISVARDGAVAHLERREACASARRPSARAAPRRPGNRPSSSPRSSRGPLRAPSSARPCRCRTGAWPPRVAACRAHRGRSA